MTLSKYLGLLVILPLFTVALTVGYTDNAYAENTSTTGGVGATSPKAFGTSGQTCGQGSCAGTIGGVKMPIDEEPKVQPVEGGPFVEPVNAIKASANSKDIFKAIYKVNAGDKDVVNLQLLIKSDNDAVLITIGGISSLASHTGTSLIKARDLESIKSIILDYDYKTDVTTKSSTSKTKTVEAKAVSIGEETQTGQKVSAENIELFDIAELASDLYKATFQVYAGDDGIPTGLVLHITSDISSKYVLVPRIDSNSSDWVSVIIQADDPKTIQAEFM